MCGIAGFTLARDSSCDPHAIVTDMLRTIAHRGPDEQGIEVLDKLALGHKRLTIMEPAGGQQPRVSEKTGNTLIYNGEIYNYRAFDAKLQAAGAELRDHCDTETLFWLLELHGVEKTLSMIDGMFAFAWYQASDDTLYLARDRFGQKPLFYAEIDGDLIFSSEIKSLRRHPALGNVTPDIHALRLYLMMEYVPGAATGIEGVCELPPGHLLAYCNGRVVLQRYWAASDIDRDEYFDDTSAARTLDELLQSAVHHQLVADVPVGIFLSGGLDSSLIAAMATQHSKDVATFSVKFPYASFDESKNASEVAAVIGTRHTTVELNRQNCIDGIEHLLNHADQPFSDSSMLPTYLLCQATKQFVTVALGGDGADELLLGYPNFKLLGAARLMAATPAGIGGALRTMVDLLPASSGYMNRAFLLRQLSYGFGKPANTQSVHWMSAVSPQAQKSLWREGDNVEKEIAEALGTQLSTSGELSLIEQCQQHFINAYLAGDILQKIDRASMYVSLEVRSPFLSSSVAEYALSLPVQALHKGMTGKRILRQVAGSYLPKQTVTRRKHGFALPVAALLRSDLRDLAQAMLLDSSNAMYRHIDFEIVNGWWAQHMARKRDHGKALWSLLMMAAFFHNQF